MLSSVCGSAALPGQYACILQWSRDLDLLRKIGDTTVQPDNAQTKGKIAKIGYLLQVTEVE